MRRRWRSLLPRVSVTLLLVACSSQLRYQVVSSVFDGVPALDASGQDKVHAQGGPDAGAPGEANAGKQESSSHPPFAERKCAKCHDRGPTSRLREAPQTYCLECHNGQVAPDPRAGAEWLHGPVAAVECLRCHEPHDSRRPHLVKLDGVKLCTQCHSEKAPTPEQKDAGLVPPEWPLCYTCHEPHGAETHYLLRTQLPHLVSALGETEGAREPRPAMTVQDPLCVACHDGRTAPSPTAGLAWVHGPVATGECLSCHLPHHPSDQPRFLRREGDALCTFCHESFPLASGPHADLGRRRCLDCHGPHGEVSLPRKGGGK